MEREANYAAVGAFVLIVTLLGLLFVYWYSDAREHRSYDRYEIYFTGSVSGLERGGAVRYLGVGVGRVVDMNIDPRDPSRVRVIVDIDTRTPISTYTVAELQLQGITGLLYIDLLEDRANKRSAPAVEGLKYPVIRSSPSRFDVLLANLPDVAVVAAEVVQRANRLLDDHNLKAIASTLENVDRASRSLPQTVHDLNVMVSELHTASSELAAASGDVHTLIKNVGPDVTRIAERTRVIADNLSHASAELDRVIAENRKDIRSFTREGLPELERFVREGREAASEIRQLSISLRENPSQLIYQPQTAGVEIPK